MERYNHKDVEQKWQGQWSKDELYKVKDAVEGKENFYQLVEFPYPSGNLHVGHWYAFAVPDIHARFLRMQGKNVLYPIGFDAFGLPAENAAIKNNLDPAEWTEANMSHMRKQIQSMGASFDWSREVVTCHSDYYKWTQWLFLQLFNAGLVERRTTEANWCPSCKTVLANEQVVSGVCERCDSAVEKKEMPQWRVKITDYADRLIDDLDDVEWPEEIKASQRNWIGRSEGAEIDFPVVIASEAKQSPEYSIKVFTTRPDTLFGVTYMVLAPEHPLVDKLKVESVKNAEEVQAYITETQKKSDIERMAESKEKTGVKLEGVMAINSANDEEIPVYIADYVLAHYGTGAIMAVPAHDERDFAFAQKYNIPIRCVISPIDAKTGELMRLVGSSPQEDPQKIIEEIHAGKRVYEWKGTLINSSQFDGMDLEEAKEAITEKVGGKMTKTYKLRDWGVSRQRYWGCPIPLVHCKVCEDVPYIRLTGDDAPRSDEDVYKFKAVTAVIKHWSEEKYLFVEFANDVWGLVGGSVKDGEKMDNALLRELEEETIYKNFEIEHVLFDKAFSRGYKTRKKREEECEERVYVVKLADDERSADIAEEEGITGWKWLSAEEALEKKLLTHHQFYFEKLVNGTEEQPTAINAGWHVVSGEQLPVELPEVEDYLPNDDGRSPLAKNDDFVQTTCPQCGGPATRETDTLDTFVDSSWYFLRYCDAQNVNLFAEPGKIKKWMPVDLYSGGAEHTTMHLLYSRFFHKALYDLKLVNEKEPYTKRINRGLIMGPDGNKMSKSKGNVIDPDDIVEKLGADTMRLYLAFIGPYNEVGSYPWNPESIIGVRRFVERVRKLQSACHSRESGNSENGVENGNMDPRVHEDDMSKEVDKIMHQTLQSVTQSIQEMKMNTGIAALMSCLNVLEKAKSLSREQVELFLQILAPYAPHITEEMWHILGNDTSIHLEQWPEVDESLIVEDEVVLVVQVNGKVRDKITVAAGLDDAELAKKAQESEKVQKYTADKEIRKVIVVQGKLVNIVV